MNAISKKSKPRQLLLTVCEAEYRVAKDALLAKDNDKPSASRIVAAIYLGTSAVWAGVVEAWEHVMQAREEWVGMDYSIDHIDFYSDKTMKVRFRPTSTVQLEEEGEE